MEHSTITTANNDLGPDYSGFRQGRLCLLKKLTHGSVSRYLCRCDCGHEFEIIWAYFINHYTSACRLCVLAERPKKARISDSVLLRIKRVKERISLNNWRLCKRWRTNDMAFFRQSGMAKWTAVKNIRPVDPSKAIGPNNFQWDDEVIIQFKTERRTQSEWAKELGVSRQLISSVLKKHGSLSKYITKRRKRLKTLQQRSRMS